MQSQKCGERNKICESTFYICWKTDKGFPECFVWHCQNFWGFSVIIAQVLKNDIFLYLCEHVRLFTALLQAIWTLHNLFGYFVKYHSIWHKKHKVPGCYQLEYVMAWGSCISVWHSASDFRSGENLWKASISCDVFWAPREKW